MPKKTVVTTGGGHNLFEVSDRGGTYYVYQIKVGWLGDDRKQIGKTRSFEDALSIIKSYTGQSIKSIS